MIKIQIIGLESISIPIITIPLIGVQFEKKSHPPTPSGHFILGVGKLGINKLG